MKKFILGVVLSAVILATTPAIAAFQPSASGNPGLATVQHLVVRDINGMRVYEVSSNPQTADEKAIYAAWLEAQVWDLQKQLVNIQVPVCNSEEQVRASGLASKIADLSAHITAFLAR